MINNTQDVSDIFKSVLALFEELWRTGRVDSPQNQAERVENFDNAVKTLAKHSVLKGYMSHYEYAKFLYKRVNFNTEQKQELNKYSNNFNGDLWINKVMHADRLYNKDMLLANLKSLKNSGINLNYKYCNYAYGEKSEWTILLGALESMGALSSILLLSHFTKLGIDIEQTIKMPYKYFADKKAREISLLDYMCYYALDSGAEKLSEPGLVEFFKELKTKKEKEQLEKALSVETNSNILEKKTEFKI